MSFGFIVFVMPVIALVGAFLATRARGKIRLSEPRCAKCGYDLRAHRFWEAAEGSRNCPECGSDLTADDAVHFGQVPKNKRLIYAGIAVAMIPLLLVLLMLVRSSPRVGAGPMGNASKTNAVLIRELPQNLAAPWHWQELEKRLANGKLSAAETGQAIDALIAGVAASKAGGGTGPLRWSDSFLVSAQQAHMVPPEQYGKLVEAYHGKEPKLSARTQVVEGRPLQFNINWGSNWDLPKTKFVQALREVRVNDVAVTVDSRYGSGPQQGDPDYLSEEGGRAIWGKAKLKLKPGVYDLTFVMDAAVLDETTTFTGIDNKPGQKKQWKDVRHSLEATVPLKLTVLPAGQEVIRLVTDPTMDPVMLGAVKKPRIIVLKSSSGQNVRYDIVWPAGNRPPVPAIGECYLRFGGKEQKLTQIAQRGDNGWKDQIHAKPLPADVKSVDLVIKPEIRVAEPYPEVDAIWGKEIVLTNIPLERHDLPETTQQTRDQ